MFCNLLGSGKGVVTFWACEASIRHDSDWTPINKNIHGLPWHCTIRPSDCSSFSLLSNRDSLVSDMQATMVNSTLSLYDLICHIALLLLLSMLVLFSTRSCCFCSTSLFKRHYFIDTNHDGTCCRELHFGGGRIHNCNVCNCCPSTITLLIPLR
jgi:hypothetical protein